MITYAPSRGPSPRRWLAIMATVALLAALAVYLVINLVAAVIG